MISPLAHRSSLHLVAPPAPSLSSPSPWTEYVMLPADLLTIPLPRAVRDALVWLVRGYRERLPHEADARRPR